MELVLALDVSGSMVNALPDVRRAASGFLKAIGQGHQVTVVAFNDAIFTVSKPDATLDMRLQALDQLTAWGGTVLHAVIAESVQKRKGRGRRHALWRENRHNRKG